jgi:hypothetical protein
VRGGHFSTKAPSPEFTQIIAVGRITGRQQVVKALFRAIKESSSHVDYAKRHAESCGVLVAG